MKETQNKKRLPKILRGGLIAAVLAVALVVTANAASGGGLLGYITHELTIVWSDGFHDIMVDEEGNEWNAYNVGTETEIRDGRLILIAMGQEEDITDDLEETGEAVRFFERDGFDLTVTVTGTVEDYSIVSSSESLGVVAVENKDWDGTIPDDIEGLDSQGESFIAKGPDEIIDGETYTFGITMPDN